MGRRLLSSEDLVSGGTPLQTFDHTANSCLWIAPNVELEGGKEVLAGEEATGLSLLCDLWVKMAGTFEGAGGVTGARGAGWGGGVDPMLWVGLDDSES